MSKSKHWNSIGRAFCKLHSEGQNSIEFWPSECSLQNSECSRVKVIDKILSEKFKKKFCPGYNVLRIQRLANLNSVDLDEAAHYELGHLDLCCLQVKIVPFLMI